MDGSPKPRLPSPSPADGAPAPPADGAPPQPRRAPRERPRAAVEREEELRRGHLAAAERSGYGTEAPEEGRDAWDERHHFVYRNDGLAAGYRSYFDRHLHHRPPGSPALGPLQPLWRLAVAPPTEAERKKAREVRRWFSCGARAEASTAPAHVAPSTRRAARLGRDRPFAWPPAEHAEPPTPAWRPGPGGGGGAWTELVGTRSLDASAMSSSLASFSVDPAVFALAAKEKAESGSGWADDHHLVWSNERNVGGSLLNPVQTRSYFDRMRTPAPADRSAQHYHPRRPEREPSDDGREPVGPVERVLPIWRLEPMPGHDLPAAGPMALPRPEPLVPHSGPGGGAGLAAAALAAAAAGPRRPAPAPKPQRSEAECSGQRPALQARRQRSQSEASLPGPPAAAPPPRGSSNPRGVHALTFAAACRQRPRLTEAEKLPLHWKLADGNPGDTGRALVEQLRRCDSDPTTHEGRWQERRREAWFSSHGIVF